MYTVNWKVRFGDIDQAQTLYYPELFDNVHQAFEAMMDELGLPLPQVVSQLGIALPIVEVNASYRAPIRFGDLIKVDIALDPGESSLTTKYVGHHAETEQEMFEVTEVRVAIDAESFEEFETVPIPDQFREKIRPAIDEAGD